MMEKEIVKEGSPNSGYVQKETRIPKAVVYSPIYVNDHIL
jgi:hypothetical protein